MREKKPLNLAIGRNVKLIREQAGLTERLQRLSDKQFDVAKKVLDALLSAMELN